MRQKCKYAATSSASTAASCRLCSLAVLEAVASQTADTSSKCVMKSLSSICRQQAALLTGYIEFKRHAASMQGSGQGAGAAAGRGRYTCSPPQHLAHSRLVQLLEPGQRRVRTEL